MQKPILLKCSSVAEAVPEIASVLQQYPLCYGQGMESAVDEAAYLVSFVAGLPPDFSRVESQLVLDQSAVNRMQSILTERIVSRTPLAYLLGETWLAGHKFYVNEHVLIPRSPIAQMICEHFFPWWPETQRVSRILDLCTGSGCLGILAAIEFPDADVVISDIDNQALQVAANNIALHGLENRIHAVLSDVYQQLPSKQYDIIIANPPYVPQTEQPELPSEFSHEPEHALFAGKDGLDVAKRIIFGASQFLARQGILVLEVGQSANYLQEYFLQHPFLWHELEQGGEGVCILSSDECKRLVK